MFKYYLNKLHDLKETVEYELRQHLKKSKQLSAHYGAPAVPFVYGKYREIILLNDHLYLIDHKGYQYNTSCVSLEDLLHTLNNSKTTEEESVT